MQLFPNARPATAPKAQAGVSHKPVVTTIDLRCPDGRIPPEPTTRAKNINSRAPRRRPALPR
jgi:hypothetical protein